MIKFKRNCKKFLFFVDLWKLGCYYIFNRYERGNKIDNKYFI